MKKIVFFIPSMGNGGAERVLAILANRFSAKYQILIYTVIGKNSFYDLDDRIRFESAGYKISKNKYWRPILLVIYSIRLYFNFRNKMNKERPDTVVSFLDETNIIASLQFGRKYKLILSERSDPTKKRILLRKIIKKWYARADVLVCQTQKVAELYKECHCVVIPNPLDCENLEACYCGERVEEIVSVGRLMPAKNYGMLISAFSKLNEKYSNYKLKIYGEGVLRERLQRQIDALNLCNRVFLQGISENVMHEYKNAVLFVMSSDYEGFPNALIEAMAMGLPVICTDFATGAARELIGEKNGLLVPVGDVQAMTGAIEKLLGDKDARESMSQENLKVREEYNADKIADKWSVFL